MECCEFITTDTKILDRDNNISKVDNLGLKVIKVIGSDYFPIDHIQTKIEFNE